MTSSSKQPQDGSSDTVTDANAGDTPNQLPDHQHDHVAQNATAPDLPEERPAETGGQAGLEPTRYGDWEKKGRCTDF